MMNHPLQQYIPKNMQTQQAPVSRQNPIQMMQQFAAAMRNPAAFVRQSLPGIPDQAFNDPSGNGVLQYMMNNMGVTQQDIQNVSGMGQKF